MDDLRQQPLEFALVLFNGLDDALGQRAVRDARDRELEAGRDICASPGESCGPLPFMAASAAASGWPGGCSASGAVGMAAENAGGMAEGLGALAPKASRGICRFVLQFLGFFVRGFAGLINEAQPFGLRCAVCRLPSQPCPRSSRRRCRRQHAPVRRCCTDRPWLRRRLRWPAPPKSGDRQGRRC